MSTSKPAHVDFHFDYSCPFAYLGSTQIEAIAERTGATLSWKPMLLGGVFKAVGTAQNLFATLSPAKAIHNANDIARWAQHFKVELRMPEAHPMRTVEALRATLAVDCDPKVIHGFYAAYFREGRQVSAPETIRDVLTRAGHDADAVLARIETAEIKDLLRTRTDEAVALGIFGAPTCIVDGELFWGQDRLDFVEAALARRAPPRLEPPTNAVPASSHKLELYWDFSSPFAYLANALAPVLAARTGATLEWKPFLLGGLFREIGQVDVPLATFSPAKQRHVMRDLDRYAARLGIPFRFPTKFPCATVKALRSFLALPSPARDVFRDLCFRAYWAEDRDIANDEVLAELMRAADPSLDPAAVIARTQTPEIKEALIHSTRAAAAAGVFGTPTWIIDGKDLYWGQDRVALIERALVTSPS